MSHNQKLYKFTARLCNEKGTKGEASFHALTKTVGNGLVQALDNITHKPEAANPHAFNASFGEVKEARKFVVRCAIEAGDPILVTCNIPRTENDETEASKELEDGMRIELVVKEIDMR